MTSLIGREIELYIVRSLQTPSNFPEVSLLDEQRFCSECTLLRENSFVSLHAGIGLLLRTRYRNVLISPNTYSLETVKYRNDISVSHAPGHFFHAVQLTTNGLRSTTVNSAVA